MANLNRYEEHQVSIEAGQLYCRDYPGQGRAFVMMHGFPDNLHVYDYLVPFLTGAGRRVVTFDFLGFGQSDKPAEAVCGFAQQLADLEAVVDHFCLDPVIPVSHDAAGPAALNYALAHPDRTAKVVVLNSAYADLPSAEWPELIMGTGRFVGPKKIDVSLNSGGSRMVRGAEGSSTSARMPRCRTSPASRMYARLPISRRSNSTGYRLTLWSLAAAMSGSRSPRRFAALAARSRLSSPARG